MAELTASHDRLPDPVAEVYPSAPLKAVAIECAFAPLLDAVQRVGKFQRKHFAAFPRVVLADPFRDTRDNLLLDEAGSKAISVSPGSVSVITYGYTGGFAAFGGWALPMLREVIEALEVPSFNTVTYRYENLIELGNDLVEDVVRLQFPAHTASQSKYPRDVFVSWTHPWPNGEVSVDLGSFIEPSRHMHLDISARRKGAFDSAAIPQAIKDAHHMARLTFEEMITTNFRDRLRKAPS